MSAHFQGDGSLEEVLDLYLLGSLDAAQHAEVAAHVARGCEACALELRRARARMAMLALSAPEAVPSPALKRRILASAAAPPSEAPGPMPRRAAANFGWSWGWGPLAVALALLCLAVVWRARDLAGRGLILQSEVAQVQLQLQAALNQNRNLRFATALMAAPATRALPLSAGPAAPRGRAYLNAARGAVLVTSNLAPAAPSRVYEMWLLPAKGKPIPAGLFQSSASGAALHTFAQPFPVASGPILGLAVSLEPAGGSPAPTGPIVLAAKLPAPE
ncbi:MAG: anti-sigma factor domain-containing protein [Terriglobales bacterium]